MKEIQFYVHIPGMILSILLWILLISCIMSVVRLGIFPTHFVVLFGIICCLIAFTVLLTQFTEQMCKKGMIAAVVLCPIFLFLTTEVKNTDNIIKSITNVNKQQVKMSIIVRADDKAEDISDAKKYKFGIQEKIDSKLFKEAADILKKEYGQSIKVKKYLGFEDQIGALYNKKVDAILFNEGIRPLISKVYKSFGENTKVLGTVTLEYEIESKKEADIEESFFNILLVGIEEQKKITTNTMSTTHILITAHPQTRQMLAVTIPDKYYVSLGRQTGNKSDLLSVANAVNLDYLTEAVEELYHTNINYFVKFNLNGIANIIDNFGMIAVKSDYAFGTSDKRYYFRKGINHMSGEEALAYWKEIDNIEDGTVQRSKNQQYVLEGIFKKIFSPWIVFHYSSVLESIEKNIETNLSEEQLKILIRDQLSFSKKKKWNTGYVIANGLNTRKYTYYSSERSVPVVKPSDKTTDIIQSLIKKIQRGYEISTDDLTIPMVDQKR
ncbi:MAG: LCP family protein [Lachnospiraceae bacterium]